MSCSIVMGTIQSSKQCEDQDKRISKMSNESHQLCLFPGAVVETGPPSGPGCQTWGPWSDNWWGGEGGDNLQTKKKIFSNMDRSTL